MKTSMPELITMQSLVVALCDYCETVISSYPDPTDQNLDELKILVNHLPQFIENCRQNVDYKLREEPTAEKMLERMEKLSVFYADIFKGIDQNSGTRMKIELLRAACQEA
jgi:hypothetical protein